MQFNQWLSLYRRATLNETRVSLLSYLDQGNIKFPNKVDESVMHYNVINSILHRVYSIS